MNAKILVVVAALLLAAAVDAQRGGGGRRGGQRGGGGRRGPPGGNNGGRGRGQQGGGNQGNGNGPQGQTGAGQNGQGQRRGPPSDLQENLFTWDRVLPDASLAEERAFMINDGNSFIFTSRDEALDAQNLTKTSALYDFSGANPIAVVRPMQGRAPCFLTDTSLILTEAESELDSRNTSLTGIETTGSVALNGTLEPLTRDAADALFESNPVLRRFCRGRKIVVTIPLYPTATDDEDTRELSLLTFESQLTLVVPSRPARGPRGPRGPRGGGNGGQGQGQGGGRRGPRGG